MPHVRKVQSGSVSGQISPGNIAEKHAAACATIVMPCGRSDLLSTLQVTTPFAALTPSVPDSPSDTSAHEVDGATQHEAVAYRNDGYSHRRPVNAAQGSHRGRIIFCADTDPKLVGQSCRNGQSEFACGPSRGLCNPPGGPHNGRVAPDPCQRVPVSSLRLRPAAMSLAELDEWVVMRHLIL